MRPPSASPATAGRAASGEAYRPEVDGLRAVAVLVVLFFHAGIPGFRGGFIGVDVFFVISGYLITRLIARRARRRSLHASPVSTAGARDGSFRRCSRPWPRPSPRSVFVLSPTPPRRAQPLPGVHLLSVSNVLFWSLAGYFDTASEAKPLLHTWSLGVEEQFYLLWPISVFLAYRWKRRGGVLALVAGIGLASLAAAEYAAGSHPDAAFFLTPFRMCELALGGLCLWLERSSVARTWYREGLTLVGLALIGYSVVELSPGHRFPGLSAMVPCAGAALVIVAGRGRIAGALLANRLAVGVGLISYSLYLVHWPLIVLWRYGRSADVDARREGEPHRHLHPAGDGDVLPRRAAVPPPADRRQAPLRFRLWAGLRRPRLHADPARGQRHGRPRLAGTAPGRTASRSRRARSDEGAPFRRRHAPGPPAPSRAPGKRNAVIVGDSHGADLLTALMRSRSQVNYRFLHIFWNCQPILGERPYGEGTPIPSREIAEECRRQSEVLRDNPQLEAADLIVIASSWIDYGLAGLPATIEYLKSRYHGRVVIVGGRFAFTELSALLIQAATVDEANERFDAAKGKYGMKQEIAALSAIAETPSRGFRRSAALHLRADQAQLVLPALPGGWRAPVLGFQPLDRSRRPAHRQETPRQRAIRLPVLTAAADQFTAALPSTATFYVQIP